MRTLIALYDFISKISHPLKEVNKKINNNNNNKNKNNKINSNNNNNNNNNNNTNRLKRLSLHTSPMAHYAVAYPGFRSMKR